MAEPIKGTSVPVEKSNDSSDKAKLKALVPATLDGIISPNKISDEALADASAQSAQKSAKDRTQALVDEKPSAKNAATPKAPSYEENLLKSAPLTDFEKIIEMKPYYWVPFAKTEYGSVSLRQGKDLQVNGFYGDGKWSSNWGRTTHNRMTLCTEALNVALLAWPPKDPSSPSYHIKGGYWFKRAMRKAAKNFDPPIKIVDDNPFWTTRMRNGLPKTFNNVKTRLGFGGAVDTQDDKGNSTNNPFDETTAKQSTTDKKFNKADANRDGQAPKKEQNRSDTQASRDEISEEIRKGLETLLGVSDPVEKHQTQPTQRIILSLPEDEKPVSDTTKAAPKEISTPTVLTLPEPAQTGSKTTALATRGPTAIVPATPTNKVVPVLPHEHRPHRSFDSLKVQNVATTPTAAKNPTDNKDTKDSSKGRGSSSGGTKNDSAKNGVKDNKWSKVTTTAPSPFNGNL